MSRLALVGLGSNLGDRKAHLDLAVASLSQTDGVAVQAVSAFRATDPVGGPLGQSAFLNGAVALQTTLDPQALLDRLHDIEQAAGRLRTVRWGERTLDLDLLVFDDLVIETPSLRVPHPRMALRRFVLGPLAEIAAGAVDPVTGRTIAGLLANLERRPSYLAFARQPRFGGSTTDQSQVDDQEQSAWFVRRVVEALSAATVEPRVHETERPTPGNADFQEPEPPSIADAARWLAPSAWSPEALGERWMVSSFWFDTLVLGLAGLPEGLLTSPSPGNAGGMEPLPTPAVPVEPPQVSPGKGGRSDRGHHHALDPVTSRRPHVASRFDGLLEVRDSVLAPTFVVARTSDRAWLGRLQDGVAGHTPIRRDIPILFVNDFTSESSLGEILATCAATRSC